MAGRPSIASVLWFRRDLRLSDNPALSAAVETAQERGGEVLGLFILDPRLWRLTSNARQLWLAQSLRELNSSLHGRLQIVHGDPVDVLSHIAHEPRAVTVHASRDFGRYGRARDAAVGSALQNLGSELVLTGSPYAVDPGSLTTGAGGRYRVFTPFYRAWFEHGWDAPDRGPADNPQWAAPLAFGGITDGWPLIDQAPAPPPEFGPIGEAAALTRWREFADTALGDYATGRNIPGVEGTSRLSAHLRWGEIHPRTILAQLPAESTTTETGRSIDTFRREIAWREFYAEVWDANPTSNHASLDLRFDDVLQIDSGAQADERFTAWTQGKTGYPFVDAGMRQLQSEGWMHNRVRMVTASFLVKDLHLPWQIGANWFMQRLRDGDAASNQHGWQWTTGCGTDAAPFYRVFNPVLQGQKFDPTGDYIRRWVPELAGLDAKSVHEPWKLANTLAWPADCDYPGRIIDHFVERDEALRRFSALPPRT
ncbi:MAG: cryptochrome/photolyase family protein [Candidatus Nanopelagicales bacterium]